MSPLKAFILLLLKTDGPLSDVDFSEKIADEFTGGIVATCIICCIELQEAGYIEPTPNDPNLWQLSNAGLEYVTSLRGKSNVCRMGEADMLVERYLLSELDGSALDEFERHLFECSTCFEKVKTGKLFAENIRPDSTSSWAPMLIGLLQLGPKPGPPPSMTPADADLFRWLVDVFPLIIVGGAILCTLLGVLLRYNERFREFWACHVCAFMEEKQPNSDSTNGGR